MLRAYLFDQRQGKGIEAQVAIGSGAVAGARAPRTADAVTSRRRVRG
jgi:hypothetical protein